MEISNLSDAEFKTLVISEEISENLNSIKKIHWKKGTLIEIKNNTGKQQ